MQVDVSMQTIVNLFELSETTMQILKQNECDSVRVLRKLPLEYVQHNTTQHLYAYLVGYRTINEWNLTIGAATKLRDAMRYLQEQPDPTIEPSAAKKTRAPKVCKKGCHVFLKKGHKCTAASKCKGPEHPDWPNNCMCPLEHKLPEEKKPRKETAREKKSKQTAGV